MIIEKNFFFQEYLDLNQELKGWSFLFCQLNYTLILYREYGVRTHVWYNQKLVSS